jgi:hypothetical protein
MNGLAEIVFKLLQAPDTGLAEHYSLSGTTTA